MKLKRRNWNVVNSLQSVRQRSRGWINSLYSKREIQTPATCGDQSTIPTAKELGLSNIVLSIKDLTVSKFIDCHAKGDLTILADKKESYTDFDKQQLHAAWLRILSEWYTATGDEHSMHAIAKQAELQQLQFRLIWITIMFDLIQFNYNEGTAELLRSEFPNYQWLPETLERDIKYNKSQIALLKHRIAIIEGEVKGNASATPTKEKTENEKRTYFIDLLLAISQFEGYKVDDTITVEVLARHKKRLEEHVERLNKQKQK